MPSLVLPGKAPYFASAPRPLLSQGDILLAPYLVASLDESADLPLTGRPLPPAVGESVTVRAWSQPDVTASSAPGVTVTVTWSPVMILSHDCEIDKEFNEQVDRFLREHPEADANEVETRFADRWDLDRHVLASPLLPYEEAFAPIWKHDSIAQAGRIGYLPVPPLADYDQAEFFVHLARVSTVERRLLAPRWKIASLSEEARSLLRFKVAEALASRNLSMVSKLETAIGHAILDVRTMKQRSATATVALVLDDGTELQVDTKVDRPGPPPPERTRK